MKASVSMEALQDVKHALEKFAGDITVITTRVERHVGQTLESGRASLNKAETAVQESRNKVRELSDELERVTRELTQTRDEYQQCLSKIDFLTGQIKKTEAEISQTESELRAARSSQQSALQSEDSSDVQSSSAEVSALETQEAGLRASLKIWRCRETVSITDGECCIPDRMNWTADGGAVRRNWKRKRAVLYVERINRED